MKIETPQKRQPCDMSTWHRITEDDGSTVAYVPDIVTAQQVIETERVRAVNAELIHACKLGLNALSVPYENGKGSVDATKALHAFGNLKFALSRAGSE